MQRLSPADKFDRKKSAVTTEKENIIQFLIIVPDSWSINKTAKFFNLTLYAVRKARELKKENGILSSPVKYSREGVSSEIKQMIINFYETEEVSQMCPGKMDCISVKIPDETKDKVKKRLSLPNTKEIYSSFKSENLDVHVSFSIVALPRPKWCIPVGSRGSHNLCLSKALCL